MTANDRQVGGSHYREKKFQHWDVTAPYGLFCLLYAASKYTDRFDPHSRDPKLGKEALEKAIHYVEKTIELFEASKYGIGARDQIPEAAQFYGGSVPNSQGMEYAVSLDRHRTLTNAVTFILCWTDITDLKSAIQWLRLAIDHYYPNV